MVSKQQRRYSMQQLTCKEPSRILRSAHSEGVTSVGFVPEGVECNLLITRILAKSADTNAGNAGE